MLNGRSKVGEVSFDWRQLALGKKYERKTFRFKDPAKDTEGAKPRQPRRAAEIHIRELSIVHGALGCAVWDGGVVLARWVFENRELFQSQTVLELGAGCGLAGILAARYAEHCTLTDYIPKVIDNLSYNIKLNSNCENSDGEEEVDREVDGLMVKADLTANTTVGFLDWNAVARSVEKGGQDGDEEEALKEDCTYVEDSAQYRVQDWYRCKTCYGDSTTDGCCARCAKVCHAEHEVEFAENSRFKCDCGSDEDCKFHQLRLKNIVVGEVDIIIGAELTYCMMSVRTLPKVIDHFLKPNGVFYEVLSNDRDGVGEFVKEMEAMGYTVEKNPVPAWMMGNYNTRSWTKQDAETYSFYTVYRGAECAHPIMK